MRTSEAVTFTDETEKHAVIALTGPEAARVAEAVGAGELNALGYFRHREVGIAGATHALARGAPAVPIHVSRGSMPPVLAVMDKLRLSRALG